MVNLMSAFVGTDHVLISLLCHFEFSFFHYHLPFATLGTQFDCLQVAMLPYCLLAMVLLSFSGMSCCFLLGLCTALASQTRWHLFGLLFSQAFLGLTLRLEGMGTAAPTLHNGHL